MEQDHNICASPTDSIIRAFTNITLVKEITAKKVGLNLSEYLAVLLLGTKGSSSCNEAQRQP